MHQQHRRQDDDELNLNGDPFSGDDPPLELDLDLAQDDEAAETAAPARPPSSRAAQAAAKRSNTRDVEKRVTRSSPGAGASKNPYRTRSAAAIRAEREARRKRSITSLTDAPQPVRREHILDSAKVADLLRNPTRQVTADQLRETYAYVLADLRKMGVLAFGLVVVLVALATLLPR
ncbi:MAG: hypothetical protein SF162_10370 [bacterium]|nr:hypothetical protein [bacterium]